jgi:hypothetical protein
MRFGGAFFVVGMLVAMLLQAAPPEQSDAKLLQTAGLGDDGSKLVEYFRRRVVSDADRVKIRELIRALGHEAYPEREKASAEIIKWGLPAVGPLREATNDKDVEIVRRAESCLKQIEKVPGAELSAAAARAIAKKKPDGAADALLTFLPAADDETVADEIREALAVLAPGGGSGDAAMLQALDDASPARRAAAGEALIRANIPAAQRLMTDGSAEVRLRVVLAAVTRAKDKVAVATLINLLAEVPRADAWRAEDVLIRLAGEQAPPVSLGKNDHERKQCRDKWAEWWSHNAASTDLKKLDAIPRTLGYTLIVQSQQNSAAGRVYEIDGAGNVLWKFDTATQPFDALVVGKDRVIVAESMANKISLRDFRGNEQNWSKDMMMPHGIQQLPDGHLLLASRNQIVELNDKRDEVFKYERERNYDICGGCKDKNGDYWVPLHNGDCIRVDGKKKELKTFRVGNKPIFGQLVGMEALSNGHVLIASSNLVAEYDPAGMKSWSFSPSGASQLSSVQRLPNGNTVLAGMSDRKIVEIDRNKEVIWEFTATDNGVPRKARRR